MLYHAHQQICHFKIMNKVLLGENHQLGVSLNDFCNRMISNEGCLHMLQGEHLLLPTMLCKKVAVLCLNWYKNQVSSAVPIPAPNFIQIFDDIDKECPWQPVLSLAFLSALGLSSFHMHATPGHILTNPIATSPAPASGFVIPVGERCNNVQFNATSLFQTYKDASTMCCSIRLKVSIEGRC